MKKKYEIYTQTNIDKLKDILSTYELSKEICFGRIRYTIIIDDENELDILKNKLKEYNYTLATGSHTDFPEHKFSKRISFICLNKLLSPDTYVYCTDCLYFRLDDEGLPYCYNENKCDINDFEDSKPFKNRPCYIEFNKKGDRDDE